MCQVSNRRFWCKIIETSKKFKTCTKVFCSQLFFPFTAVDYNEGCSSLRSFLKTSILTFFGRKTKPSSIKYLNISLINFHSVSVKCKDNSRGNKVVSSK